MYGLNGMTGLTTTGAPDGNNIQLMISQQKQIMKILEQIQQSQQKLSSEVKKIKNACCGSNEYYTQEDIQTSLQNLNPNVQSDKNIGDSAFRRYVQ